MSINNDIKLINDFKEKRDMYETLDEIVSEKIRELISEKEFFIMDMVHRVKTVKSLQGKINRKSGKYKSIYDITDLCGIRIICYFSDTVDEIAASIREIFDVDEVNSVDKRANLQATQFGYLSLHYICSLKKSPEYDDELTQIKFEIQMRTVLQHAWAEIEHDLGYKSEFGVPRAIRREFSRIAGLLEIADGQFVDLRYKTKQYVIDVRKKIADSEADELLLDQVTLEEYVMNNKRFINVLVTECEKMSIEYIHSATDKYLVPLDWLGVKTLGDLENIFKSDMDMILELINNMLSSLELNIITTGTVLRYLCISELIKNKYNKKNINRCMKLLHANEEEAKKQTEKIYEYSKEYWKKNETN